ncbi:hypothetical protein E2C01_098281 [Portunus trituberculatus]|uniref:Uncharacterized protein n=1 Tax=Portunus trituberculatus TaxID=210409 RepID=A0A5B7KDU1_PORTR|nr:hypothetical protein [Portunus trituberculatus]
MCPVSRPPSFLTPSFSSSVTCLVMSLPCVLTPRRRVNSSLALPPSVRAVIVMNLKRQWMSCLLTMKRCSPWIYHPSRS